MYRSLLNSRVSGLLAFLEELGGFAGARPPLSMRNLDEHYVKKTGVGALASAIKGVTICQGLRRLCPCARAWAAAAECCGGCSREVSSEGSAPRGPGHSSTAYTSCCGVATDGTEADVRALVAGTVRAFVYR